MTNAGAELLQILGIVICVCTGYFIGDVWKCVLIRDTCGTWSTFSRVSGEVVLDLKHSWPILHPDMRP